MNAMTPRRRGGRRHDVGVTLFWRLVAVLCILLGLVGVVLPVMPTVPFLLLAAAAASRGWPWLDERLTGHARYGPLIVRWRERRAIPRRAKWLATIGMTGSAVMVALSPAPLWLRLAFPLVLLTVAAWIWSRPES
jgi:uncharacterized membrane protein YbaN (DUF454 family)